MDPPRLGTAYSSKHTHYKKINKGQFEVRAVVFCPAKASTAGAPAANSEAILPSASTSTAMGVPVAPNLLPMLMPPASSNTTERSPIAWLDSTLSVETTSNWGASVGGLSSQALRSASIRWQKPQLGRQKSISVVLPRKSERLTVWPERSGRLKSGAGAPIFGPTGGCGASARPLPLLLAAPIGRVARPAR